jgi:hypothetical protein
MLKIKRGEQGLLVGINRIVLQTLTFTWTYRLTTIGYFLLSDSRFRDYLISPFLKVPR